MNSLNSQETKYVVFFKIYIDINYCVCKYLNEQFVFKSTLMNKNSNESHSTDVTEKMVTLRIRKEIVDLIDRERAKFSTPRSSWIIQAVVEKLEKLGYNID